MLYNHHQPKPMVTHSKKTETQRLWSYGQTTWWCPSQTCPKWIQKHKSKKVERGQKLTWLKQIEREIKLLDFDLEQAIEQAQNREHWQGQIERIMHLN